jgi:purine-binding chemotaxis protein CheW
MAHDSIEGQRNLITFRLGQETYALPVEPIMRIVPMVTITPLPEIGDPVAGVINVRGQAVPVVDLRWHVGLEQSPYLLHTPIILAQIGQGTVGLVVDEVLDVLGLASSELIPPDKILPEGLGQAPVLNALVLVSGHLAPLLDPEHLFGPEQQKALAQVIDSLRVRHAKRAATLKEMTDADGSSTEPSQDAKAEAKS